MPALSIRVEGEEYANYLKGMGATIGPETNLDFVSNNHDARNAIQQLIKYEEPSTLYSKDYWLVNGSLQNDMGDCFSSANQIAGFVMTNAAIYPALNPVVFNGDFEFQIISPHTDEKGNVNTGSYDMSMSTNLVRCLYRLGSNPYKASVSVLNFDGTQKVATTTVAERFYFFKSKNRSESYSRANQGLHNQMCEGQHCENSQRHEAKVSSRI